MELNWTEIRRRSEATVAPMRSEFDNIKGRCREIAKNMLPAGVRGFDEQVENYTHRAKSDDDGYLVCTIPLEAVRKGAAGFLVNLMNPARKWFHLNAAEGVAGAMGVDDDSAKSMLEKLECKVYEVMQMGGAYIEFKRVFEHLLVYGYAAMIVKKDSRYIAKAECLRPGTYALGVDSDGSVNRLYRRMAMTPEEMVRTFGGGRKGREKMPDRIISAWKRGDNSSQANVVVCNLIEPNEDTFVCGSDERLNYGVSKSRSYRSIYWIEGETGGCTRGVLDIRGFRYNPIIAPRLSVEKGDIYGRGRGEDALNACRAIQALRMDELMISSNRAEPPLLASNDLREEGLGLGRGQVTYTNLGEQNSHMVVPVLPNPPTSDETRTTLTELMQEIRACMFNDEFATIDSLKLVNDKQKRTAAEINALTSENMLLLAGIILMLDHELLDPVVKVFTSHVIESAKGMELPQGAISVQYVSNLHMAQMAQEVNSVDASVARAANLVALGSPKTSRLLDNFNFDMIVRKLHGLVGASQDYLVPMASVEETRMAEDAAAKEQAEMAKAQQEAELELERAKAAAQSGRAVQSEMNAQRMLGDQVASMGGYM